MMTNSPMWHHDKQAGDNPSQRSDDVGCVKTSIKKEDTHDVFQQTVNSGRDDHETDERGDVNINCFHRAEGSAAHFLGIKK